VLETLRNLLKEVNAILAALRQMPGNPFVPPILIERIQELVLTWSLNVRPGLAAIKVPKEVLNRADADASKLARLAAGNTRKRTLASALNAVHSVLLRQILVEVARIPPGVQAAFSAPSPAALFPEISDLPNQLVPYAVQGWSKQIKHFLAKNPFGRNVFVMVSYRASLNPLIDTVKDRLVTLGLNPIVAKEHSLTNDLYNPIACLLCCSYGVAIFDRAQVTQTHNPNVVYELGMMQLLKRPCIILKHTKLRRMPTDLLSMLYEGYSSRDEAAERISGWWARHSA
jgi:hypothetical protein